ncbi:MAG: hypothetical protein EOP06_15235 [Proteobacteria bacterium]|nr:MAG: hypothetical protein EOP06_15235 [Pseudomonadota bacterium]
MKNALMISLTMMSLTARAEYQLVTDKGRIAEIKQAANMAIREFAKLKPYCVTKGEERDFNGGQGTIYFISHPETVVHIDEKNSFLAFSDPYNFGYGSYVAISADSANKKIESIRSVSYQNELPICRNSGTLTVPKIVCVDGPRKSESETYCGLR